MDEKRKVGRPLIYKYPKRPVGRPRIYKPPHIKKQMNASQLEILSTGRALLKVFREESELRHMQIDELKKDIQNINNYNVSTTEEPRLFQETPKNTCSISCQTDE